MIIEQIAIKNFKLFKDVKVSGLQQLSVFLGTNGSGKSTLFDVFSFLSESLQRDVTTAVNRRGGFKELISRGANTERDKISFGIKFRNPEAFKGEGTNPLITYSLEISFDNSTGRCVVDREILKYRRGNSGKPWHFLDFNRLVLLVQILLKS